MLNGNQAFIEETADELLRNQDKYDNDFSVMDINRKWSVDIWIKTVISL